MKKSLILSRISMEIFQEGEPSEYCNINIQLGDVCIVPGHHAGECFCSHVAEAHCGLPYPSTGIGRNGIAFCWEQLKKLGIFPECQ